MDLNTLVKQFEEVKAENKKNNWKMIWSENFSLKYSQNKVEILSDEIIVAW
jgi:hypothetical protein